MFKAENDGSRLVKNFSLWEMANKDDGAKLLISPKVVEFAGMVQEFSDWYAKPMTVTSWLRTPAYNGRVGGASNSMHLEALAVDWKNAAENAPASWTDAQWRNVITKWHGICYESGLLGGSVEIAPTWAHFDVREWADKKFHVMNHKYRRPASAYVPAGLDAAYQYI